MSTTFAVIGAVIAVAALYVLVPVMFNAYRRFRGARLVRCPETGESAAVEVDAARAALSAAAGASALRLRDCSRWPEREDCGQKCLRQIELAPEDCLVRKILTDWYEGKSCALCGHPFERIQSWGNQPGFRSPDGKTMECREVRSETLPEVLSSHQPVCWNCHTAETFRRLHPELVIDQPPAHSGAGSRSH